MEIVEKRQMVLHDNRNSLLCAKQEGKKEGKLEAKLEIARQLLDVLDVETIAQKTRRRLRLYDRRLTDD